MPDYITLSLKSVDVGQLLDGLEQRRIAWLATAEYLGSGYTELSDIIEECSDPYEAQAVADYYQYIINTLKNQRDMQLVQKGNSALN
ncbi:MAG: hypothetical protein H8E17_17225 [Deltaproteobacteria bacterium]|nr:hypothetical protein [Deltaproteobacteria bacterium]